jgi:hypothetical protein
MIPTAYDMEVRIAALQAAATLYSGQEYPNQSKVTQTAVAFEVHLKREA